MTDVACIGPARYVAGQLAERLTGLTAADMHASIASGAWRLGEHFFEPTRNALLVDWRRVRLDMPRAEPEPPSPSRYDVIVRQTPPWADLEAIAAVYAAARRITAESGVAHHVDHILPLRGRRVSGLHVAANLRVLPAVDNWRKNNRFEVTD